MKTQAKRIALALAMTAGVALGGCGSNRTIHIQGIGDICRQNVRVDVVGVNWMEKQQWEKTTMQEYWAAGNPRREDSLAQGYNYSVRFGPTKACEVTLREKDPIWKKWNDRGATHFFVMFDTCTDANAWYVCLPLATKPWHGRTRNGTIEVQIQPPSVVAITSPKPERK
jgi:hypothetical protein